MKVSKELVTLVKNETLKNKCGLQLEGFVYYIEEGEEDILIDEYVKKGDYYRLIQDNKTFTYALSLGNTVALSILN